MRILLITTVYPSAVAPNKGAFNKQMIEALSRAHDVKVVCPIPWIDARRTTGAAVTSAEPKRSDAAPPRAGQIDAYYPVYFYTPKVLRQWYGHFFWWSIRQTLRSIVADFAPDVVMGYWAH